MTEHLAEDIFRTAAESIEVLNPPLDGVVDRARQQRRRRRRTAAASVAGVLVVVAAGTWVTTRPEPDSEPLPTHVVASQNPVSAPWYDGRLHLRAVAVDLPHVTSLASVGEGVAYLDTRGNVGVVTATGVRTIVGSALPGSQVLGSSANNWVAWLEPSDRASRLVVWGVGPGEELGRLSLSPVAQLISIDQNRVYYQDESGAFAWQPTDAQPEQVAISRVADVGSSTRVYQRDGAIEMVQQFFSVSFTRPGEGATVSPGGNFVLSRAPGSWLPGTPYTPLVYDARTGRRLPSGVGPDERVVDATFGDNYELIYLVAHVSTLGADLGDAPAPLLVLRTCELDANIGHGDERECHDVAPVRSAVDRAMFAH